MEWRNPKYVLSNNLAIDVEINHAKYGWIPTTLIENDPYTKFNSKELWDEITAGSVTAYAAPSNSVLYADLRSTRNKLLLDSDWTQVGDLVSSGAMTSDKLTEWKTYRQSLRDLPANTSDPSNVTWPTKPT